MTLIVWYYVHNETENRVDYLATHEPKTGGQNMEMKIEIRFIEALGLYTVYVNDEILMECLSEEEVKELTFGTIKKLVDEFGI